MSGIYLHIPYCRKACHYCDFHFSTTLSSMEELVRAMVMEMEIRSKTWPVHQLETIYFGGGTPSILPIPLLTTLFDRIHSLFSVLPGAEITLEANPDDINETNLRAWKSLGINRLSIGLQSSHDHRLTWMNRLHSADQGKNAVQLAQQMGFNFSLDLMYNFPDSPETELEEDLDYILSLQPNHISAYGLTIEPQTVFGKRYKKGDLIPLPEDRAESQFRRVRERLVAAGFDAYEISNFGLPGHHAVHNKNYWFQKPYFPVGPGAHGFDGKTRFENLPNNARYIKSLLQEKSLLQDIENLYPEELANEMILTRLRTQWGLFLPELEEKTGINLLKDRNREITGFLQPDLVEMKENTLYLTEKGKILADRISMELMF